VVGGSGQSRAHQLLGSLGLGGEERLSPEIARKTAYLALLRAVVLGDADLARQWGVVNQAGVEERWRDDQLWLLSGLREILEVRCFYYHLKEVCRVAPDRLRRVERVLRKMRRLTFDLRRSIHSSP
jgi:hypothetical protein